MTRTSTVHCRQICFSFEVTVYNIKALEIIFTTITWPVLHRSAVFMQGCHCLLSSVYRQLRVGGDKDSVTTD
jgi:hypothetical protein